MVLIKEHDFCIPSMFVKLTTEVLLAILSYKIEEKRNI